jgi:hypothetical protein
VVERQLEELVRRVLGLAVRMGAAHEHEDVAPDRRALFRGRRRKKARQAHQARRDSHALIVGSKPPRLER